MPEDLLKVIERLEEDIVFGRRRPRERLGEEDLVTQFGAKKHVIRQALAEVERMGLVERKRNKGAIVRDYTPEEVRQLLAATGLLLVFEAGPLVGSVAVLLWDDQPARSIPSLFEESPQRLAGVS